MKETTTILLVDDNEELRISSAALLAEAGYRVLEAADARDALHAADAAVDRIALVVTDVNMPGESGIRLVEKLRQRDPRLPVVFTSGHIDERLATRLAAGDASFLAKPFGPVSLREALATARRAAVRAESATPVKTPGARPDPPARHRSRAPAVLALAASLVIGLGLALKLGRAEAPVLPAEVPAGVARSIRVEPLFPAGELEEPPKTLAWKASAGAEGYRVEIRRIGYDLVWRSAVEDTAIVLPPEVRARLDAGVIFTWQVEALYQGESVARSEVVRFRISTGGPDSSSRLPRSSDGNGLGKLVG